MPERGTLCPRHVADVCAYSREEVNVWSGIERTETAACWTRWRSCSTCRQIWWRPAPPGDDGSRQLYLEHHTGILAYSDEQIDVNTTGGVLRVRGARLALMAMTAEELRIGGDIAAVEWVR